MMSGYVELVILLLVLALGVVVYHFLPELPEILFRWADRAKGKSGRSYARRRAVAVVVTVLICGVIACGIWTIPGAPLWGRIALTVLIGIVYAVYAGNVKSKRDR